MLNISLLKGSKYCGRNLGKNITFLKNLCKNRSERNKPWE